MCIPDPSFKEPTSPRNIAPLNNMVGNSGHSQNLDDPVNDLAEHDVTAMTK